MNLRIVFGQSYANSSTSIISKRACERVIREPDEVERVEADPGGKAIVARAKRLNDPDRGPYIGIVTTIDEGDVVTVAGGFRIPPSLAEKAGGLEPSRLLRELALECGIPLNVNGQVTRYIDQAFVDVDSTSDLALLRALEVPKVEGQPWIIQGRRTQPAKTTEGYKVEIRDFFCLDRLLYLQWLYGNEPV